jgi:membrane-associated phospholipid phosphatase
MLGLMWTAQALIEDETQLFLQVVEASPISFHAAIWVETPGNSVFLIPIILIAATIAIWWNAPLRALSIVAAFMIIDTIVLIGWLGWDRQRPKLIYDGIAAPGFHSFPSGHVAQTIAVYGLLTYFWISASRRRSEQILAAALCTVLVIAVGLARLCLGTHWPSDLGAGALVGGVWLTVIIVALRKAKALGAT